MEDPMEARREAIEALVALSVFGPRHAAIRRSLEKLRRRFMKHAPSHAAVRQLVDESMGPRRLTDELQQLRKD